MQGFKQLFVIACATICLVAAALAGWLALQNKSKPSYETALAQATEVRYRDPTAADALYRQALAAVERGGAHGDESRCSVFFDYGEFLSDNWRPQEALEVFRRGVQFSRVGKSPLWEGSLLVHVSFAQHQLFQLGRLAYPDPGPALQAIQVRAADFAKPTRFASYTYNVLATVYADNKNFTEADKYLTKTLELTEFIPKDDLWRVYGIKIESLVAQAKYKEANTLFIEQTLQCQSDEQRLALADWLRQACSNAAPANSGVASEAAGLLADRQFEKLDVLHDELLKSQKAYPLGRWYLSDFYAGVNLDAHSSDSDWKKHMDALQSWVKERPQSDAAKIALANNLAKYTQTDAAWKALQDVKRKTPEWYTVAQAVALAANWKREDYEQMYAECRNKFPSYANVVADKARWLQETSKSKGETEDFLAAEADKLGGEAGNILYARTVWQLEDRDSGNIFANSRLSWPRTRDGFRAMIKKQPSLLLPRAELSALAMQAEDRPAAETAFDGVQQ